MVARRCFASRAFTASPPVTVHTGAWSLGEQRPPGYRRGTRDL